MTRKRIHTRTIVVELYEEDDGTVSIEGNLQDTQPEESGYFKTARRERDPRPPGVLHGMSATFRVDRETAEILRTEGEFPHTPHERCDAVVGWLSRLDGARIAPGYTAKQREALGGPKGCVHMNTLLQVMANTRTAAMSYYMPSNRDEMLRRFKEQFQATGRLGNTDSCHVWRQGGPREQGIREEMERAEAEGRV